MHLLGKKKGMDSFYSNARMDRGWQISSGWYVNKIIKGKLQPRQRE